ncbi:MAG: YdiU family protein [Minicystis sp.]
MPPSPRYRPDPRTPTLGEGFFDAVEPARFPREILRFRNDPWAERVGLGGLDDAEWVDHFARFRPLPDNLKAPLALRYHGYQFGVYNARLGDGRGFLFAQLRDPEDERLLDLGTKGSGRTPWSRDGDGRLTLKGGVREALATELLEALGVYTSKTLSLVETGEELIRHDEPSPTRASVLVRLSHGHVRFGSFERHARAGDRDRIQALVDFSIASYYPDLAREPDPTLAFFTAVSRRMVALAASWMAAGFVHGVLNTDNMNVTGESFDYGPYRFLPHYDPRFVAAYFDEAGRYAFGRQAEVLRWNLERLADALAHVTARDRLVAVLHDFEPRFLRLSQARIVEQLGLVPRDALSDFVLASRVLCFLDESRAPWDQFFFDWWGGAASEKRAMSGPSASHYRGPKLDALRHALEGYSPRAPEQLGDAFFGRARPASLVYDEIEALWAPIAARDDWSLFHTKIADIRAMGRALGRPAATHVGPPRIDVE